ncbi:MAG: oxygenase MpaB family protein [Ktedonobacteraceae bacterium]
MGSMNGANGVNGNDDKVIKHPYGFYGPGSVAWKVGREVTVLLGGSRAVLMQLAHPLVAMGVSAHSSYMSDPFGRAERTFMHGEWLMFGSLEKAHKAAREINRLHKGVHGTLPVEAGAYGGGTPYDARYPELLLWVHATLVDTLLLCYELFIGPLTPVEQDEYYQQSKEVAHLLGLLPEKMPGSVDDLRAYVNDMVHSNRLAATPQARRLAQQVLFPPAPAILRPAMHLNYQLTCALLPQAVREIYGFEWDDRRQRIFDFSAWGMRKVIPRLPVYLRELPVTRHIIDNTLSQPA